MGRKQLIGGLASVVLLVVVAMIGIGSARVLQGGRSAAISDLPAEGSPHASEPTAPPTSAPAREHRKIEYVRLPPEGTLPSRPEHGELVVRLEAEDVVGGSEVTITDIFVYADGRVVSHRAHCLNYAADCERLAVPKGTKEPNTGWVEQRLTPSGVERLRMRLLATGMFKHGVDVDSMHGELVDYLHVSVRTRDRLVRVGATYQDFLLNPPTNRQLSALEYMQGILFDLDGRLPDTEWADRRVRAFVPSRYALWFYPRPPRDPSDLPAPADELFGGACTVVSTNDARAIARGLRAAGISRTRTGRDASIDTVAYRVNVLPRTNWLLLEPRLPDQGTAC